VNPRESTTRAVDVQGLDGRNGEPHVASDTDAWSFGSRDRLFASLKPVKASEPESHRSAAANQASPATPTPRNDVDVSGLKPVAPYQPFFGKRGFMPLYQWEGVVEEINGESFRARLRPFEDGRADAARVEYADFEYGDLADDSDLELVSQGAVFYWTVGKSRNAAGTLTNTSLVRFRRLPPASPYQARETSREAEAMLADLGAD
jgi:hypothetical protein